MSDHNPFGIVWGWMTNQAKAKWYTARRALGFKARCVCPICGQGTITVID